MAYYNNRYSSPSGKKTISSQMTTRKKKKKYRGLKMFLGGMILLGSAGVTCKLVKDFFRVMDQKKR